MVKAPPPSYPFLTKALDPPPSRGVRLYLNGPYDNDQYSELTSSTWGGRASRPPARRQTVGCPGGGSTASGSGWRSSLCRQPCLLVWGSSVGRVDIIRWNADSQ